MKAIPQFRIRTILVLTVVAALATVFGLREYKRRAEELRQVSLRAEFGTTYDFLKDLDLQVRSHLISQPEIEERLRSVYRIAPEDAVSDSFLAGGYGGSGRTGEIIEQPEFSVHYSYSWGPQTRVANESEKFQLKIFSKLEPATMLKPRITISTRGTELEEEMVDKILKQLDEEKIEIQRIRSGDLSPSGTRGNPAARTARN